MNAKLKSAFAFTAYDARVRMVIKVRKDIRQPSWQIVVADRHLAKYCDARVEKPFSSRDCLAGQIAVVFASQHLQKDKSSTHEALIGVERAIRRETGAFQVVVERVFYQT